MKKILILLILLIQSTCWAQTVINDLKQILAENNGLTADQKIRFDFPWKTDQVLLKKIDHYVEKMLLQNSVKALFKISTTATDRIEVLIIGIKNKDNSLNGIIVKKKWRGLFHDEFSYKIIPLDYLNTQRSIGKIDKYELGFITADYIHFNKTYQISNIFLNFPRSLGSNIFLSLKLEIQSDRTESVATVDNKIVRHVQLITDSQYLQKIEINQ